MGLTAALPCMSILALAHHDAYAQDNSGYRHG